MLQAYFRRAEATRMRATQLQTHMDMYDKAMADYAKTYCLMSDPKSINFRVERIVDIIKMGLERGMYDCCVYVHTYMYMYMYIVHVCCMTCTCIFACTCTCMCDTSGGGGGGGGGLKLGGDIPLPPRCLKPCL